VFNHFSQRFTVEVNDSSPGARVPVLQFCEGEDSSSVLGEQMSAGLHQMLGLIANLVGREGLVIFLEHPEEHLHPQSMRYLQNMLVESSERNQLIVTTHSPYFINPGRLDGLRRFWIAKDGAKVKKAAYMKRDKREAARFETALREVGRREMLFARAVILTEEDTTVAFLAGISDVLKKDVNAHGVSIVSVGGDSAFVPYHALLDSLEIPHVNLRDGSWGDNPKYPKERFFSFDAESFEKFMDKKGFCELRKRIAGELGASDRSRKPEVARELARRLKPEQVPDIFRTVLDKALELAKAEPKLDTEVPHANN
jgi:hypothetical protein